MDGHCRLISSKRGAGRYFSDALLNIFGSSLSSDWGHPTGVKYRNPTSISQFHIVNNIIRVTYNVAGIYKAGRIWGLGFTPKVIWAIVKANAKSCGLPSVAPHHLRRTCARLCHQAGDDTRPDPVARCFSASIQAKQLLLRRRKLVQADAALMEDVLRDRNTGQWHLPIRESEMCDDLRKLGRLYAVVEGKRRIIRHFDSLNGGDQRRDGYEAAITWR